VATATANYDGASGGAMVAATGSHTMSALVVDGTTPPTLSLSNPYTGNAALRWAPSTLYGFQNAGTGAGWFRTYLRIAGTPAGRFFIAARPYTSYTGVFSITIGTDRRISVHDAWGDFDTDAINTNATKTVGTVAIPSDQWVRIEGRIASGSTVEARLWLNPTSTATPSETLSVASTTASFDDYWIGAGRYAGGAWTTFAPSGGVIEVDGFEFDTDGYPGPVEKVFAGTVPI